MPARAGTERGRGLNTHGGPEAMQVLPDDVFALLCRMLVT